MVEVKKYHFPPTSRVPNSRLPLLHYPGLLSEEGRLPVNVYDKFTENEWQVQWIARYAHSQMSHYHSRTHECMAVLTGHATIRFGVADTNEDLDDNTHGSAWEEGGIDVDAKAGDVFILPAGLAHKTYNTKPDHEFKFLLPGEGHGVPEGMDARKVIAETELSGFTMMGAYPIDGASWDFVHNVDERKDRSKNKDEEYETVWSIKKPKYDPILGESRDGLRGQWE